MIGIRFVIPNAWGIYLSKILEDIDTKGMKWYLSSEEVHSQKQEFLFNSQYYNDKEFREIINKQDYYIIFANIQAYNEQDDINKIESYNDFKISNCRLVIIINDCELVDIYAKDENILKRIKHTAIENDFKEIEELYNDDSKLYF